MATPLTKKKGMIDAVTTHNPTALAGEGDSLFANRSPEGTSIPVV
jgi:hypothetical protein